MTTTAPTSRLAVGLAGLSLQNPLLLASGTAGYGRELDGVLDLDALGGLVTKAVSIEPRDHLGEVLDMAPDHVNQHPRVLHPLDQPGQVLGADGFNAGIGEAHGVEHAGRELGDAGRRGALARLDAHGLRDQAA